MLRRLRRFRASRGLRRYFTDYARYSYDSAALDDNEYLRPITPDLKNAFLEHIEDFEKWVDTIKDCEVANDLVSNYDFDLSVISDGDYVYIYDDPEYNEFGYYDVCFFDVESNTLFFFHNNV